MHKHCTNWGLVQRKKSRRSEVQSRTQDAKLTKVHLASTMMVVASTRKPKGSKGETDPDKTVIFYAQSTFYPKSIL